MSKAKSSLKTIDQQLIEAGLLFNEVDYISANGRMSSNSPMFVNSKGNLVHAPLNRSTPPALFKVKQLPPAMRWLLLENAPKVLVESLRHYGVLEHPGIGSDANIMSWAKEVGVMGWYTDDDIPWCGLFVAMVIKRCGYKMVSNVLRAREWAKFGNYVKKGQEKLWDILVFSRPGGGPTAGHVGFYVGESKSHFLVYGGNQGNAVGFAWIAKSRLVAARRCPWAIGQPANIRKVYLTQTGAISTNEK